MKLLSAALVLVGVSAFSTAQAAVIDYGTYQLNNHPNAAMASPGYGLRLDGLLDGDSGKVYTFDFDDSRSDVKMTWDGTAISIFGDVWGGRDTGSSYGGSGNDAARLWDLNFTYDMGVSEAGGQSSVTVSGTDMLNTGSIASDLGLFDLTDVGNPMHHYTFKLAFDHRGFSGISGWGWLNHCVSDDDTVGAVAGADCAVHEYSSDFLFTATKVPEPSTIAILMAGLAGLAIRRRKH
jgi:hypothetical protein